MKLPKAVALWPLKTINRFLKGSGFQVTKTHLWSESGERLKRIRSKAHALDSIDKLMDVGSTPIRAYLWNLHVEEKLKANRPFGNKCLQCGNTYSAEACGPTHAAVIAMMAEMHFPMLSLLSFISETEYTNAIKCIRAIRRTAKRLVESCETLSRGTRG